MTLSHLFINEYLETLSHFLYPHIMRVEVITHIYYTQIALEAAAT